MALIKCVECGREISDKAAACIHCGCPISVSTQSTQQKTATADNELRVLNMKFNAVLNGDDNGTTMQKVYVKELGREVEFPIKNNTKVGDTIRTALREGSGYSHIIFTAVSVRQAQQAPASSAANPQNNVNDMINQIFGAGNQNVPTVSVEAKPVGPQNASTPTSVFVPAFNRTITVNIPNSIAEGGSFLVSAGINTAMNGINSPLKVHVTKVTHGDAPNTRNVQPAAVKIDVEKKIKELKLRVYVKPVISLIFSVYFLISTVGLFVMMYLFPDGGAPEFLINVLSIGFGFGFLPVFYFKFLPYIIGRYPEPGFFKTYKIMKHLEKRQLLGKAVVEMETCELFPFGDKMCLSNSFLFPKKKNGVIIPCDELLWVYNSFSNRRGCGYLMLGTKKWGVQCFSRLPGRKQNEQRAAATIQAVQRRNPNVLVGETRENRKKYFQMIKN